MKGVIFNAVEETVRLEHGEDAWDQLLETAGVDGAYTSLGTYPDEQLYALVAAACDLLGVTQEDLLRHLGRRSFGHLAGRNPALMTGLADGRSLLLALNGVIHPEVRKVYPEAEVPEFLDLSTDPGSLSLQYNSQRGLCHLAEGLALGVADHFGESMSVSQPECRHRGDERCVLQMTWPG